MLVRVICASILVVSVGACRDGQDLITTANNEIQVYEDEVSFEAATGDLTVIDFEAIPYDSRSCPDPFEPGIDNPLLLEGVTFSDPHCLRTGFCSAPACPEANNAVILSPGGTVVFPQGTAGVMIAIEGMGDSRFVLEVHDFSGTTETVADQGIPWDTRVLGFTSPEGIAQLTVVQTGPTPGCPEPSCGPVAFGWLKFEAP